MKIQKIFLCISALLNIALLSFVWFKFSQLASKLPPDKGVQTLIPIITGLEVLVILIISVTGVALWKNKKYMTMVALIIFVLFNSFSFLIFSGIIPGPKLCGPERVIYEMSPAFPGVAPVPGPGFPDTVITCTQSIFSIMPWQDAKTHLEWGKYKF